jgi:2-succinyl-6-hydroxy-2,4-cyclohexadiene-1-carboxylate synthase
MQHADTWSPIAAAVGERYPVKLLDFTTWTFEQRLAEIDAAAGPDSVLVGYSMGGRLALHAALRARLAGLVVLGASAGIEDARERRRRREADDELAEWIESHSIEDLVDRWEQNPVFASQSPELVKAQRSGRLDHDPAKLAQLLRSAGQGALAPIWDRLGTLTMPVMAMAGEKDPTYIEAAKKLAAAMQGSDPVVRVVEGCGHGAHLEAPDAVAREILEFLRALG